MTSQPKFDGQDNLQLEVQMGREFSLGELIGREGGDFMKGESPIPPLAQAVTEIKQFIANHLQDSSGCLQAVLQTWVSQDEATVSRHFCQPLFALEVILKSILENRELLYELVKQVDFKWGQLYDEKPYFQKPGEPPDPEDEYSHELVYQTLSDLRSHVNSSLNLD